MSQFTLQASTREGQPAELYQGGPRSRFSPALRTVYGRVAELLGRGVATGEVTAPTCRVELVNDGPVTIWMDSKNKE